MNKKLVIKIIETAAVILANTAMLALAQNL